MKVFLIISISEARPIANSKLADARVFKIFTKSFEIKAPCLRVHQSFKIFIVRTVWCLCYSLEMSCPACSLFAHNELVGARTVRSNQIIRHIRCLNCSVFDGPYLVNNQDHLHDTLYSAAPHHCILIRSDMSDSKLS